MVLGGFCALKFSENWIFLHFALFYYWLLKNISNRAEYCYWKKIGIRKWVSNGLKISKGIVC